MFDSLLHSVLLQKLQGIGITRDIWLWIRDYLANQYQVTTINGCSSSVHRVTFGVPQGHSLFSLFCNDLPDIVNDCEGEFQMYADDITIYVTSSNPNMVATSLNFTLSKLTDWHQDNFLAPHLCKTEVILMKHSNSIGPLQGIKFGSTIIN